MPKVACGAHRDDCADTRTSASDAGVSETLAALATGIAREIAALALSAEDAAVLDGLGLSPGRRVTVLRRAAFDGPLHVRVDTGVELALDPALAAGVTLRGLP